MRELTSDAIVDFVNSSLDKLRGDWTSEVLRDDAGFPVALVFEGPAGVWSQPISLRLSQRTLGVGKESVNLGAINAGQRLIAVLALELAGFIATYREPLVRPPSRRA